MSYLVTGGTGLLGSRIVRNLVRQGHDVVVYDVAPDATLMANVLTAEESTHVELAQGDILDYDSLAARCDQHGVTRIVHTASMLGNADQALRQVQVNIGGAMNVLEVARRSNMAKVVVIGSNSVYDKDASAPITATTPFRPYSLYGATKAFNEYAADIYFTDFGLDVTTLRIGALLFGPGQRRGVSHDFASETVYKPAVGLPGRVVDDPNLAWLYVEDAARAVVLACKHRRTSTGGFNVGGTIVSTKELAAYVQGLIPGADIELSPAGAPSFGPHFYEVDMSETEAELGFRPEWDVWDAFRETINITRAAAGLPPV